MKLLVSYDSFATFTDILGRNFHLDINAFRIVVDEAQCIIKDVCIKEYNNNNVLSSFLNHLFQYRNILFVSATPLFNYLQQIDEFKQQQINYVELVWPNITPVIQLTDTCVSSINAFDKIYANYSKHIDPNGRHVFDTIYASNGHATYSYEFCIFLNSVKGICKILKKYIRENQFINSNDVSVICANNKENEMRLNQIDRNLHVTAKIPQVGEQHPTFTFVTRTCFDGCDFYSPSATTYIIANYNIKSLQLDIATDIPQIIGRQRVKENRFRNTIHIFYTGNKKKIEDEEFQRNRQERMEETNEQIMIWESAPDKCKKTALNNINKLLDNQPGTLYLKTIKGVPELNQLIILSEDYCRDIVSTHTLGYITQHFPFGLPTYSPFTTELKEKLDSVSGPKGTQDRLRLIGRCAANVTPDVVDEIFQMLHNEGYNTIAEYLHEIPLDRMAALGYDTWKIQQEIQNMKKSQGIKLLIQQKFIPGQWIDKQTVKRVLQDIYDQLGIKKHAKAIELLEYMECRECKQNGIKGFLI